MSKNSDPSKPKPKPPILTSLYPHVIMKRCAKNAPVCATPVVSGRDEIPQASQRSSTLLYAVLSGY
jgi:hypothetical protein